MLKVVTIPFWNDNFAYAFYRAGSGVFSLVDPACYSRATSFISNHPQLREMRLGTILSTHKHHDHCGDNDQFAANFPNVKIYGGVNDNIKCATDQVKDGEEFQVEEDIHVKTIETPCHTSGHVIFHVAEQAVFVGDTVFIGGCGRFFEGGPADMLNSLKKFASLPDDTLVYCGHEYTVSNLSWAASVEPNNTAIATALQDAKDRISKGMHTVPTTVGTEKEINLFIRAAQMKEKLGAKNDVESLAFLREMKNAGSSFPLK